MCAAGMFGLLVVVLAVVMTAPAWADGPNDAPSATQAQLDQLTAILSRPEFQAAGRGWLDGLLAPVRSWFQWLLVQILRLFVRGIQSGGDMLELGVVLIGVVTVIVAAIGVR